MWDTDTFDCFFQLPWPSGKLEKAPIQHLALFQLQSLGQRQKFGPTPSAPGGTQTQIHTRPGQRTEPNGQATEQKIKQAMPALPWL